ncbi:MAG: hypothetical protein JWO89_1894 [Verrucomicrobiaceae bacterium]|nr:hypothetical protein [Verrucomicrobiaceae bacterium]
MTNDELGLPARASCEVKRMKPITPRALIRHSSFRFGHQESIVRHYLLHTRDDFTDAVGKAVRLADGTNRGVGVGGAQEQGKLTEALDAVVIDLHHHEFLVTDEGVIQTGGEGMNVADVHASHLVAFAP